MTKPTDEEPSVFIDDVTNRYDEKCPPSTPPSCLRSNKKGGMTRNVSFPDDETQIVTGILEPESPWMNIDGITNDDLISLYMRTCEKHGTYPVPVILEQLAKLDLTIERNESFSLKGLTLDGDICETLEEILKRVQFQSINLEGTSLNDETSVVLFDMLEYYESATKLNVSGNPNIGVRGWQACSRLIKKTYCLEELEVSNTIITETHMPILSRALKLTNQLQILKLENCNLTGRPLVTLASALKSNSTLRELYLSKNDLVLNDAGQLSSMIKSNVTLQLLDISHNNITDAGMNTLMDSIIDQCFGLSVLIVWNNHLTRHIANSVSRFLEKFTGLEMLNIGMNTLGDEFLRSIKLPLTTNRNLLKLGMQSTYLSDEAAFIFSEILTRNSLLQRIDLRDNNIQMVGLKSLLTGLQNNSTLLQLDLDKLPRKAIYVEDTTNAYKNLVDDIRRKCSENEKERELTINSETDDQVEELSRVYKRLNLSFTSSRKLSLTCETLHFQRPGSDIDATSDTNTITTNTGVTGSDNLLNEPKKNHTRLRSPAPSPIPSPVSTPPPIRANRFVVEKVQEKVRPPSVSPLSSSSFSNNPSRSPSPTISAGSSSSTVNEINNRFTATAVSKNSARFKIVVVEPAHSNDQDYATNDDVRSKSVDDFNRNREDKPKKSSNKDRPVRIDSTIIGDNNATVRNQDECRHRSENIITDDTEVKTPSVVIVSPRTKLHDNGNFTTTCKNDKINQPPESAVTGKTTTTSEPSSVKINQPPESAVTGKTTATSEPSSVKINQPTESVETGKTTTTAAPSVSANEPIPITEKIRKLSWVSPLFQSSSAMIDTNKIPANLEKLLSLFQNPFTNTRTATTTTTTSDFKSSNVEQSVDEKSSTTIINNVDDRVNLDSNSIIDVTSTSHVAQHVNRTTTCTENELPIDIDNNGISNNNDEKLNKKKPLHSNSVDVKVPILHPIGDNRDRLTDVVSSVENKKKDDFDENIIVDKSNDNYDNAKQDDYKNDEYTFYKMHLNDDINDNNNNNTDYEENNLFGLINQYDDKIKANFDVKENEMKDFPATWPQKLTANTPFLCSPSRSSPSILEATALMFLQGQVSSDLAGIQSMNLSREEKAADQM